MTNIMMNSLAQPDVFAISILILSIFMYLALTMKKTKKGPLPPGPRGLPIVGYMPFMSSTDLRSSFTDLAQRYGPIFKLQMGSELLVVVSSPSLVKEVTRDQDVIFANHHAIISLQVLTYGGIDIVFSPHDSSRWRDTRKVVVQNMLGRANLDASFDLRKDEVMKAIDYVGARVGTPVEIGKLMFQIDLNVILGLFWGRTLQEGGKELSEKIGEDFKVVYTKFIDLLAKPNISDFLPMLRPFDIQGIERESKDILQIFDKIFDAVINEFLKKKKVTNDGDGGKKDFIQILLESDNLKDAAGEDLSMKLKKSVLMDIVIGGIHTVFTTTEWAMTEIIHHREILEKIQKELDNVVGGVDNDVEESHLSKLTYLEAAVKEAMRLHPVLPLLVPRRPTETTLIGGYTIPKGTTVMINAWAIQRDPEIWEDPLVFRPERFLQIIDDPTKKFNNNGSNVQYIPFGSGRRVCAGISLAERMLMYVLASLFHSFDWKPTRTKEEDLIYENYAIVTSKRSPLLAIPTKRDPKI